MYTNESLNIPAGMRDWLPPEAGEKRCLINKLLDTMFLWGYEEVASPLLEHYAVLTRGEPHQAPDNLYKLIERDGSILALRPEMTTPIARMIGSKMTGEPPWRLMYGGEVFRYEPVQAGRLRAFHQVGVELIGEKGPQADSEVLALACCCLKTSGMENFTVSLGHMGVLNGLLESLAWEEQTLAEVRSLVLEKDFVGLHHLLERLGLVPARREEIVNLLTQPYTPEDLQGLIPKLPAAIRPALHELVLVSSLLAVYGYTPYLQIDLSTLRSQTYYTGMVFEIYTKGIGYPIGGGGRYDQLLCKFGRDYPSTGFALGIERMMLGKPVGKKSVKPIYLAAEEGKRQGLFDEATRLREEGRRVLMETRVLTKEEAELQAQKAGAELLFLRGEKKNGR